MQTRSSSRLVSNPSSNPIPSTYSNPKGRNRRRSKQRIEEFNLDELSPPIVTMADHRTMAQLLQAPTEGYEDEIVVPAITTDNFELKHGLLTLRFDESFSEAWDRFKDLLRAYPRHDEMPRECIAIIESKSKVCYSRNKPIVAKVSMNTSTSGISPVVAELKDMVKALLLDKKSQNQAPATIKAVEESCVMHPTNNGSTKDVQPPVVQSKCPILTSEPVNSLIVEHVASPVSAPRPNQRPSIPYPSRMQDQKLRDKTNDQREKFFQIFKDLNFNISFAGALILMPKKAKCLALADLGPSINLMPLSVWNKLSLPNLTPTCMNPELADHSISHPVGVAEDVYVKWGELTLRVGKEAITFNLDQTSRYSANYNDMTAKLIDVIGMACVEYSQEVLGFSDVIASGNPTPYYDPIVSTTSPTLTPFEKSDFLLEEVDAFLALEDDPTLPKVDQSYLDSVGDILLLEAFLNDDPSLPSLNQGNYLPEVCDDKLPVIIAKDLSMGEKTALITVLKSHKRAIAWKLSDIKGIDPVFCTHKILMEEDFKPAVQHQRRVNPKIHDVIKQEGGFTVVENKDNEFRLVWWVGVSASTIIRRKPHSSAHTERLLIAACLLGYAMHQAHFKEKMLKMCEDTNLCLNWEKSHFMVKEGIVLGHKISKEGIEVDKAKVDDITKLPHPTIVKGIRSFLGHASFYRRKPLTFLRLATIDPPGDTMAQTTQPRRCLIQDSIGPPFTVMPRT
nr:hypothetical protein [Tanacetum cinerariifolium]